MSITDKNEKDFDILLASENLGKELCTTLTSDKYSDFTMDELMHIAREGTSVCIERLTFIRDKML